MGDIDDSVTRHSKQAELNEEMWAGGMKPEKSRVPVAGGQAEHCNISRPLHPDALRQTGA